VSPVARRVAAEHGLELAGLTGSGRAGRVTKRDVVDRLGSRVDEPGRRPIAAAATLHALTVCDMARTERRCREPGLTPLALVARAAIQTLRSFPDLNAWLDGDRLHRVDAVHLGVAPAPDRGSVVGVVREAQNLSEQGLAAAIADLRERARSGRLASEDAGGATFTITGSDTPGVTLPAPLLTPPGVAILELEPMTRQPVVVTDAAGNESLAIRSVSKLILGWDERAAGTADAAGFLAALRARIGRG
jgi:pyruvate dehydrogenase E2 component (dihydrolipoamide acetyltransferase)